MAAKIVVYLGPARCGKTEELLRLYRSALQTAPNRFGNSLWLAPTSRSAALVREQLLSSGPIGCFNPGVTTFNQLIHRILASTPERVRRIDAPMQRELLRRIVIAARDRGELAFHAAATERPGFVDLLVDHFRELKRHDILPDAYLKARSSQGDMRQQQELAQLYADYQRRLTTHHLVDAESALWAARNALAAGACHEFQHLELLVADGFAEFTHTQHEILSLLAGGAKQLLVTLQADTPPESETDAADEVRTDLFAKTTATLAALRRRHPKLIERHLTRQPTRWPARDFLLQQIFRHPQQAPTLPAAVVQSLDRFEIVEAAGAQDEIVQLARRIKKLLVGWNAIEKTTEALPTQVVRPSDIVVVFRSMADSASRVREVFDEFGIPFSLEAAQPLAETALCKALLALLRLDAEDWPFRRVVSIIANRGWTAIDDAARTAADRLIHQLQIAHSRRELMERTEQLAAEAASSHLNDRAQALAKRAKLALPALQTLAAALDSLPLEATSAEWCQVLERLGARLGLSPFVDLKNGSTDEDVAAWQCVVDYFASLRKLDAATGQSPRVLARRELLSSLVDAAQHAKLPRTHDDVGRVRVLSASSARSISARHLFLAGMSEQAFPAAERTGRLCNDSEYRYLARVAGQGSAPHRGAAPPPTRSQEEMLLFYGVLSCASESITISYPALDDKAQALPASPYVTELRRTLGTGEKPLATSGNPQLSPIPLGGSPLSYGDWRIQAVAEALGGNLQLLAGLYVDEHSRAAALAIDAGLRIVHDRSRRDRFGAAEGLLESPAAAARFSDRFGPQHLWSPSQWETYAACPYKFFVENVLKLEPLGDLELETDYLRRGSRLHDVLAEFHRLWSKSRPAPPLPAEQEALAFVEHLRNVVDGRVTTPAVGIEAALAELDRRQIRHWAERHFEHHAHYQQLWSKLGAELQPAHFELRFGPARPNEEVADDPHSHNDAFTLKIGKEQVRVTGRIDRIDVARVGDRVVFSVIDYKSGKRSSLKAEHIATGEHLQLPIYVAAAQALLFDGQAHPLAAGYWTMSGGFDAKGVLAVQQQDATENSQRWSSTQTAVEERIGQFIGAIRRGEFPVLSRDDHCTSRCDFHTICRIAQVRSMGKAGQEQ